MSATARSRRGDVAIVGAGIGGLTLALALRRAGTPCHVYEQTRRFAEAGAGLQLAPNAVRVLHRLGLREALRECAVRVETVETRRWDDGTPVAGIRLGAACEQLYGAPYYTVHRARLHAALSARLGTDAVSLGHRLTGLDEQQEDVGLHFADGRTRRASVAVGADGVHSRVRATIVPDAPVPARTDIYRGLVAAERLPAPLRAPRVRVWTGPGRHCVTYPVSADTVSFAATVPAAEDAQCAVGESWSAAGDPALLLDAYRGWHPLLRALFEAAGQVRRWALHDRDPVTRWCTARTALLGDAAHPMLPFMAQGANQAVEDAAALAVCLTDGHPVPEALRRYAMLRIPRTTAVQQGSRANGATLHLADGAGQRRRDAAMQSAAGPGAMAWLYGHDAEAAAVAGPAETAL
ncbi:MAG TPA: FAD-dependent monooxygenase [Streptomyces sp.]|nr:FAD-dependent monooxygenase [Streptomyces sp.]